MRAERMAIPSRWGVTCSHTVSLQDHPAPIAAVLFPGNQYHCGAPLLAYTQHVCRDHGCDVLALEYGH